MQPIRNSVTSNDGLQAKASRRRFLKAGAGVAAAFALSGIDARAQSDARRFEGSVTQGIYRKGEHTMSTIITRQRSSPS